MSSNVTCNPNFNWSLNANGDTPCTVGAKLESICTDIPIVVPPLPPSNHYQGPSFADANPCSCSSVVYSLLSACGACQARIFGNWSSWNLDCPTVEVASFPKPIPSNIGVPAWAYLNVSVTNDTFDPGAAQLAASQTPSASQSSSSFTQTSLSATPTNAGDTVTSSSKSNAGPIAGGVVGGIIVIAAVGLAVLWYYKRSQRVAYPSANLDGGGVPVAAPQMDEHMDDTRHLASPSSLTPSRPIYDSSDTTSFNPGSPVTSGVYTTFGYRASMESINHTSSPPRGYTGAAEV